jgi:hypothetical protein
MRPGRFSVRWFREPERAFAEGAFAAIYNPLVPQCAPAWDEAGLLKGAPGFPNCEKRK